MGLSLVRVWLLRVPLGYVLGFVLAWGSTGIYCGMVFSNIVCALAALWLFRGGSWESAVIETRPEGPPSVGPDEIEEPGT